MRDQPSIKELMVNPQLCFDIPRERACAILSRLYPLLDALRENLRASGHTPEQIEALELEGLKTAVRAISTPPNRGHAWHEAP